MHTKASDSEFDDTCMYLECGTILVGQVDLCMVLMDNRFVYLRKIIYFSHKNAQYVQLCCIVV